MCLSVIYVALRAVLIQLLIFDAAIVRCHRSLGIFHTGYNGIETCRFGGMKESEQYSLGLLQGAMEEPYIYVLGFGLDFLLNGTRPDLWC